MQNKLVPRPVPASRWPAIVAPAGILALAVLHHAAHAQSRLVFRAGVWETSVSAPFGPGPAKPPEHACLATDHVVDPHTLVAQALGLHGGCRAVRGDGAGGSFASVCTVGVMTMTLQTTLTADKPDIYTLTTRSSLTGGMADLPPVDMTTSFRRLGDCRAAGPAAPFE